MIDLGSDLLNYIVERDIQPGDRLPSISELKKSDHLGISISKVREQLEVARALGLVEVRSKIGTKVQEYDFTPTVRLSLFYALARDPQYFESYSQVRTHIEYAFWLEACELLTEIDFDIMRDCIQQAESKLNGQWIRIPHDEHRTFHLTVFNKLNNPFVLGLLEAYWDAYDAVQLNTYTDYDRLKQVWDFHKRILVSIEKGDYEESRELFMEHTQLLRYQPRIKNIEDTTQQERSSK